MKKELLMAAVTMLLMTGCSQKETSTNPFFAEKYGTPYEIPPFCEITIDDIREAMLKGIEEEKATIQEIAKNKEAPTFENTILALDNAGALLTKVSNVFSPLSSSDSNQDYRDLQKEISPLTSELSNSTYMNDKLFQRVKKLYDKQEQAGYNKEQKKLIENYYKRFVRNGANLNESDKLRLAQLNNEISMLQLQFDQNLLHETNNTFITVDKLEDLEGLPQSNIDAAAEMAKKNGLEGKWMFNMQRASCNPVLQYCNNRELRKKVYDAYYNRGNQGNEWDNNEICVKLLDLRLQKAKLMGFEDYASFALDDRMAKTSENVYNLLDQIWEPAVKKAQEELNDIRAEIRKEGKNFEPEGWDYMYYMEKAKKAKFNIDDNEVRPYLEVYNVQQGIFYVANKLYGLTFTERTDLPKYHPDTKTFEVRDKDGSLLALFYSDYFPRDGKGAGAWCTSFRGEYYKDGERVIPIVVNVASLTPPNGDTPALQNVTNITTEFHEFGHALHSFMRDVQYRGTGGVERDFVEVPSQINEHWALEPEILNVYAKHYQTGEVIPLDLVKKIQESEKYGQGFATVELVAASLVDMDMHTLKEIPANFDVMAFEQQKLNERGIPRQIFPRYRVTNFEHTMGGGYTAGYYSYLWAEVYECDAFQAYKEAGNILDSTIAQRFRDAIFTPGGIDDGMTMYRNFRGRDPKIDGLLENRGLK
ncbi:MAG: M3 family metallopeptidase [Bacteroidaceae bacterium]|nr:M3 family metallopeptidase [Bacteroidaceae bacterium]